MTHFFNGFCQDVLVNFKIRTQQYFFMLWLQQFSNTRDISDKDIMKNKIIKSRKYFWVSYKKVLSDLPAFYKNKETLITHIEELEKNGFIIRHRENREAYIAFGNKWKEVLDFCNNLQPFNSNQSENLNDKFRKPYRNRSENLNEIGKKTLTNSIVNNSNVINSKDSVVNPIFVEFCNVLDKALLDTPKHVKAHTYTRSRKNFPNNWYSDLAKVCRIKGITDKDIKTVGDAIKVGKCREFNRGFLQSPSALIKDPFRETPRIFRILEEIEHDKKPVEPEKPELTPQQKENRHFNLHFWEYANGTRDIEKDISDGLLSERWRYNEDLKRESEKKS